MEPLEPQLLLDQAKARKRLQEEARVLRLIQKKLRQGKHLTGEFRRLRELRKQKESP